MLLAISLPFARFHLLIKSHSLTTVCVLCQDVLCTTYEGGNLASPADLPGLGVGHAQRTRSHQGSDDDDDSDASDDWDDQDETGSVG